MYRTNERSNFEELGTGEVHPQICKVQLTLIKKMLSEVINIQMN